MIADIFEIAPASAVRAAHAIDHPTNMIGITK